MTDNEQTMCELQRAFSVAQAFSQVGFGQEGERFAEAMKMMREDILTSIVYECDGDNDKRLILTGCVRNMDEIISHVLDAPDVMRQLEEQIHQLEKEISQDRNTEVGSGQENQ